MNPDDDTWIVRVPVHDTGIGKAAGFKDDADLIAHHKAQRAAMSPEARRIVDQADADLERRFLFGDDHKEQP